MATPFPEIVTQHGGAEAIPHEVLYNYIQGIWPDLLNLAKLGTAKIPDSALGKEVRRRTRRDLMWVMRYFTWGTNPEGAGRPLAENKITEAEYRVMADFFVSKNETKDLREQDVTVKNRLLLFPRGGLKSTWDVGDATQWILCFPEIRILFLTGADDLAVGFVDELKNHFLIRPEDPSLMNLFFPEYCLGEHEMGNQFEFTCPLWRAKGVDRKEPTVMASSIGSTKSGWHFEVIKADDAVCDKNSESSEQCGAVSRKLFLAKKLLKPGGFYLDYIGTRYHDDDHYGVLLEKNVGRITTTRGRCWEMTENADTGTRILVARGIQIKPEVLARLGKENRPLTYPEAGEAGCDLLVPTMMPYNWLMREYRENEESFEAQINQNPRPAQYTTFDQASLIRATIPWTEMPQRGPISHTWDFAFSAKKGRDYSTGCSAIWNEKGQMCIHDMVRGRFKPNDLAREIAQFTLRWHPFVIGIEKAAGSNLLEFAIIDEAKKTGNDHVISVCSKIDWFLPDTQKDAKRIRMAALHPWLVNDRLKFANYLPHLAALYSEFEKCLTSHHHDDIPDVISQQPRYAPRMQQLIADKEMATWSASDASWNLLFVENCDAFGRAGMGDWTPPLNGLPVIMEAEARAESGIPGLPAILGAGITG